MSEIQFIPKEFNHIKLGYNENYETPCTPGFHNSLVQLSINTIIINAPQKIICVSDKDTCIPVFPICAVYDISSRRGLKYAHLQAEMAHIKRLGEDVEFSAEVYNKSKDNEYPYIPPDYFLQQEERARKIEDAQKYSDDELNEGQRNMGFINVNLMEYVDMPFAPGSYEVWLSFCGLESNRVVVEIVFQNNQENNKLNEKWTATNKTEGTKLQTPGAIEIKFLPDGTFRYDERRSDESVSYANGTYYYREHTGEIFVHIESGGYDWITRQATETMPPLYWGEVYFNYQFYLKITKRSDSIVTVIEHILNHEGVSDTAIWKENNGNYSLISTDPSTMKEQTYTVDSLAEPNSFR